ncbi:MAG: hypothetical protein DSM107014_15460 [Gomphosphaeria aponina SAG 52.96 = DSM 107014]|uniref:Uncharacterized protein n=1 Tax=Gomphosphaeria aponina SAG 52.96 = DSM 107014 TaxID=1521640 RepID=A0A941GRY3_9CHRO|nr:hypothetical protein [Gomphosphaeria aponina SAG 52.96 = DSM 107014]
MLVIFTQEQILNPTQVCQSCLLADRGGKPRWHHGKLGCGHALRESENNKPALFECEMGFQIVNLEPNTSVG